MRAAASFAAEDLACRRGGRLVFEALSFRLEPGDTLLLRGPNGSGKSSLLRILAGFLRPAAGRLTWGGTDVADDLPAYRAHISLVAHADAVKPLLSVAENLKASAGLLGTSATMEHALDGFALGLLADTLGRFLSSGQRRRAALARLLAAPRPLWLLDEPGVGLDRASRGRLEAAIAAHRETGGICVVASHGDVAVPNPLVLDFGG
jgi:heme exporter protein A